MTNKAHTYNWQKSKHDDFWDWATVVMLSDDPAEIERMREVTDEFTSVSISVSMNGVEMNAAHFFKRIMDDFDRNVENAVKDRAREIGLNDLRDEISQAEQAIKQKIRERMLFAGITWEDDDDYR